MTIDEVEYKFICGYRSLSDLEQLAVRRAVHLGDLALLRRLFRERSDQLNDLGRLPIAEGDDQSTLFSA